MAIYSLHHSSIGKSTQTQPYTASAHVQYITRERAVSRVEAGNIPTDPGKASAFFVAAENKLRKNARVADKIMLALPRELTADQRAKLVSGFAEAITEGRAAWFAAFHEKGKDAANPHCHLMIADRDIKTGKRVFGMSEKGSTERLRRLWENHANEALAQAQRSERIDRRTLRAQGVVRQPTIHVGVRSRQLIKDRRQIVSRNRNVRNHCQARTRTRTVAYPTLDVGKLRLEHNIEIRRANLMQSRAQETESDYWQAIDRDAFQRDIKELRALHAVLQVSADGKNLYRSRDEDRDRHGPDR